MNTIALWYESNDNGNSANKKEIGLDIHINFWKLKKKYIGYEYLLDLGFMIEDISKLKFFHIYFPFQLNKEDFEDIGDRLIKNHKLINSIFNENYEIHTTPSVPKQCNVQDNKKTPLFNIYAIDFKNHKQDFEITKCFDGTKLTINLENIRPLEKCYKYYFRIRLKSNNLQDVYIRKYKPKNWFFQSALTETETIDFRINEKRNYNDSLAEEINKYDEFLINKIHFLLMRYSIEDFDSPHINVRCRELENDLWRDYIPPYYNLKNIIAYHWSEKAKDKPIDSFNTLVKIKYYKSNWRTILAYIFLIGILSIFFNVLSNYISSKILLCHITKQSVILNDKYNVIKHKNIKGK